MANASERYSAEPMEQLVNVQHSGVINPVWRTEPAIINTFSASHCTYSYRSVHTLHRYWRCWHGNAYVQ